MTDDGACLLGPASAGGCGDDVEHVCTECPIVVLDALAMSVGCSDSDESACVHCSLDAPASFLPHEGSLSAMTEVSVRGRKAAVIDPFGACFRTEVTSFGVFAMRAVLLCTMDADMFAVVDSLPPECVSVDVTV